MVNSDSKLCNSISESLHKISEDFMVLDQWEDRYGYIIELGSELESYPKALYDDEHKVQGCMSQVWLTMQRNKDGSLHFCADSDAFIVKGLIAILLLLYNDRSPNDILSFDASKALGELNLDKYLSPNRRNGFVSVVEKIKQYAKLYA